MNQLCFRAGVALKSLLCFIKDKCMIRIINCINVQKRTEKRQYDLEGVHRKLERIILMFSHIINFRVQVHSPLKAFISNHIPCRCASFFSYRIRKYAPAHFFFFSVLFSIKYICKGVELTRRALCCC